MVKQQMRNSSYYKKKQVIKLYFYVLQIQYELLSISCLSKDDMKQILKKELIQAFSYLTKIINILFY